MATILVSHTLNSEHWIHSWSDDGPGSRRDMFREAGVTSIRMFQSPATPDHTGLLLEVEDLGRFLAFSADPASVEKMAEHDIDFDSVRILVELNL